MLVRHHCIRGTWIYESVLLASACITGFLLLKCPFPTSLVVSKHLAGERHRQLRKKNQSYVTLENGLKARRF